MADILERLESVSPSSNNTSLREVRLGGTPEIVMLFTRDHGEVKLHYINDSTLTTYVACPGQGCPVCFLRSEPVLFLLLPVLHVEAGEVKVLRVPLTRGATALADQLTPFLKDADISSKVLFIRRERSEYSVQAQPLGDLADHGEAAIKAYLSRREQGLKLESAFLHLTAKELADIPTIQRKLSAVPGWQPPTE